MKLFFATEIVCYYDADERVLYILNNGGLTYYTAIFPSVWSQLLLDPTYANFKVMIGQMITPPRYDRAKVSSRALANSVTITRNDSVEMFDVNSSNVKAVGYDAATSKLYVQYLNPSDQPIYEFDNVSPVEWEAIRNADSKGSEIWWSVSLNHTKGTYRVVVGSNLEYTHRSLGGTPHPDGYITIR